MALKEAGLVRAPGTGRTTLRNIHTWQIRNESATLAAAAKRQRPNAGTFETQGVNTAFVGRCRAPGISTRDTGLRPLRLTASPHAVWRQSNKLATAVVDKSPQAHARIQNVKYTTWGANKSSFWVLEKYIKRRLIGHGAGIGFLDLDEM